MNVNSGLVKDAPKFIQVLLKHKHSEVHEDVSQSSYVAWSGNLSEGVVYGVGEDQEGALIHYHMETHKHYMEFYQEGPPVIGYGGGAGEIVAAYYPQEELRGESDTVKVFYGLAYDVSQGYIDRYPNRPLTLKQVGVLLNVLSEFVVEGPLPRLGVGEMTEAQIGEEDLGYYSTPLVSVEFSPCFID